MSDKEICWMTALKLTEVVSSGEISPVDVLDAVIEQIRRYNPELNAIVTLTEESAIESAKKAEKMVRKGEKLGPLLGVPITLKDLVFTKGVRTTFGSKLYENFVPDEDAVLVERLRKAGAVIIGKTNVPEFGLIPVTDNLIFGPTRNPWDKSKTSGGSSGGAATAVAAGMGPLASGSDGGGSIRIPSSLCGVYGFKPSFGRVPSYPRLPGWETMDCLGPITRTVSDAALMLDVIAGPDERDRFSLPGIDVSYLETLDNGIDGSRLAYSPDLGYAVVDQEVEKLTRKAAFSFEKLDCEVKEINPDLFDMQFELITRTIAETITANEEHLEEWKTKAYPLYLGYMQLEETFSIRDVVRAQYRREELWEKVRKIFENYDFLLTPTTAVPAFELEEGGTMGPTEIAGETVGPVGWIAFTYPFNFTGQPAASVPCGFTGDGLPVGLQIVGRRYDDDSVLRASKAFEKTFPWQDKKPPL